MAAGLPSKVSRRHVLQTVGGAVLAAAPFGFVRRLAAAEPARGRRVVVLGGGFAGATVTAELRRLVPEAEVALVEPMTDFFPGPTFIDVAFGRRTAAAAASGYAPLVAKGARLIRGEAKAIDLKKRVVETTAGSYSYDALVMATGIRLAPEEIKGLAAAPATNATLYDRAGVVELAKRIASFAGGTVVISVPPGALKCPPAPYELALLMAERMKAKKLKGKIVLIDAWPTPQPGPLGDALMQALSAHGDLIDYLGQAEVQAVDTGARKVSTTLGEEFSYDLLSLIPPNRASRLVLDLGLADKGDVFVAVDPVTLRSAADPHLFAAGDVARTPFGKSAAAAADMGQNCAYAIARMIGVKGLAEPTVGEPARVNTVCYPYVDARDALGLEVVHTVSGKGAAFKYNSRILSNRSPAAANVARRHAWEAALVKSALGG